MLTIPSHGWFMTLFYHVLPTSTWVPHMYGQIMKLLLFNKQCLEQGKCHVYLMLIVSHYTSPQIGYTPFLGNRV